MNNNNIFPNTDSFSPSPFDKQNTTNAFSLKISELYFREDNPPKKHIPPYPTDKASKFKKTGYIYKKSSLLSQQPKQQPPPNKLTSHTSPNPANDYIHMDSIKKSKFLSKHKMTEHPFKRDEPSSTQPQYKQNLLIPSLPENYLDLQKNIRHSNPILWMIRHKNKQSQLKDIEIENIPFPSPTKLKHIIHKKENKLTPITKPKPTYALPKLQHPLTENTLHTKNLMKSNSPLESKEGVYGNNIQWKKGEDVHIGKHSIIYKAFNINEGKVFIVKEYKESTLLNKKYFYNEIKVLKVLHHSNIVNCIGGEVVKNKKYVYLDLVPGGNVREFINNFGGFTEGMIKNYIKQIISVLEYLNMQGLIYGNLSLEHLLIDCDGLVKFIDFSVIKNQKRYNKKNFDFKPNFDISCFARVVNEIVELCERKSMRAYTNVLKEYCDFLKGHESNMITFREIKTHPFLGK